MITSISATRLRLFAQVPRRITSVINGKQSSYADKNENNLVVNSKVLIINLVKQLLYLFCTL